MQSVSPFIWALHVLILGDGKSCCSQAAGNLALSHGSAKEIPQLSDQWQMAEDLCCYGSAANLVSGLGYVSADVFQTRPVKRCGVRR